MFDGHANFSYGTVTTAPSPGTSGTTVVIGTASFAQFPDPSTYPYNVTVWPSGTIPLASNAEISRVVAKGTNGTLNLTRAQESSTNRDIGVGDQLAITITKKTVTDIEDAVGSASYTNLLKNGNFINNSTNGYGGIADDWTNSSANPVQGGFPSFTKQQLIDLLGIVDGDIEGLWNLNEASGNATDLSSSGYTLTDTNTVLSSDDGLMGKARDFELDNTEYLSIADASCPNLEISGSQTWFCFVKPESLPASMTIMGKKTAGAQSVFAVNSGKAIINFDGLVATNVTTDVTLQVGKWYLLVGIYDSANSLLKIWCNGVKKQVAATGLVTDTNGVFAIGAKGDATTPFDGLIQNTGVLSVALSDAQVKRLWAFTSYKGQKIRRATTNAVYSQALNEDLVERLRGKTVTLRATMWQDTASTGTVSVDDGSATASATTATTGAWVDVSVTKTISATATAITVKLNHSISDGNTWLKEVALYVGSVAVPYSHSADDWNRLQRLLKMDIPSFLTGAMPYQYEEDRWYTSTTLPYTGFSANPSANTYWKFQKTTARMRHNNGSGTSNANFFTIGIPITALKGGVSVGQAYDNSTWTSTPGYCVIDDGSTIASMRKIKLDVTTDWTTSNNKTWYGNAEYSIT